MYSSAFTKSPPQNGDNETRVYGSIWNLKRLLNRISSKACCSPDQAELAKSLLQPLLAYKDLYPDEITSLEYRVLNLIVIDDEEEEDDDGDDYGVNPPERDLLKHNQEDVITKNGKEEEKSPQEMLEAEISEMAHQLKNSSLHMHSTLAQQNKTMDHIAETQQGNLDKVHAATDSVQTHLRRGWKRTVVTWTLLLVVLGCASFVTLVIRTIPKRKGACLWFLCSKEDAAYQSYQRQKQNIEREQQQRRQRDEYLFQQRQKKKPTEPKYSYCELDDANEPNNKCTAPQSKQVHDSILNNKNNNNMGSSHLAQDYALEAKLARQQQNRKIAEQSEPITATTHEQAEEQIHSKQQDESSKQEEEESEEESEEDYYYDYEKSDENEEDSDDGITDNQEREANTFQDSSHESEYENDENDAASKTCDSHPDSSQNMESEPEDKQTSFVLDAETGNVEQLHTGDEIETHDTSDETTPQEESKEKDDLQTQPMDDAASNTDEKESLQDNRKEQRIDIEDEIRSTQNDNENLAETSASHRLNEKDDVDESQTSEEATSMKDDTGASNENPIDNTSETDESSQKEQELPEVVNFREIDVVQAAVQGDCEQLDRFLAQRPQWATVTDHNGWQPIHEAARRGHTMCVKVLISFGADINARTGSSIPRYGPNVLWWVEQSLDPRRHQSFFRFLIDNGAVSLGPTDR